MSSYRRYYIKGGTSFFTVNLHDRRRPLLTRHINLLRQAVNLIRHKKPFIINAWVILPEHMHCIWTLPEDDDDYSGRWRDIKKTFTKSLRQEEGKVQIWQPRFWEHGVRDEEDYRRHVDYIYVNPLKHGLVQHVKDWPYSTFHRDVKDG
ncbi:transposase [Superficieibacter electus]|uniref:Transposase n=1 Tax=Superficieibacter electus TaxID=2022662 RepID=A0A2P5GJM5_9ENTR|nr:transposase [Superficieibacter electus]POP41856.1 transposase [Superficieibacter electus]POP44163.1 transposase [Superficieibacter electus]